MSTPPIPTAPRFSALRHEVHAATGMIDGLAQLPKYAIVGVLILVVDRLERLAAAVDRSTEASASIVRAIDDLAHAVDVLPGGDQ